MTIDAYDTKILRSLSRHGRISVTELAEQVGLSHSAVLKRLRKLEDENVIKGYQAIFNNAKLGGSFTVLTHVSLSAQKQTTLKKFEEFIRSIPEIMDCLLMTGDADYFLKIVVDDLGTFERILTEKLAAFEGVTGIKSSVALRAIVEQRPPPAVLAQFSDA